LNAPPPFSIQQRRLGGLLYWADPAALCALFARPCTVVSYFTVFVAEEAASAIIEYFVVLHCSPESYLRLYSSLGILDELFQLLVFYEIAVRVFCPTGVWARDVPKPFFEMVCLSAIVAGALTWLAHPVAQRPIQTFVLRSNFFSAALMSEFFVGTLVLAATVGLPWRTHVTRIAQGLGAYSIVCMPLDIVKSVVGVGGTSHVFYVLAHTRSIAYVVCEVYWIVMLWLPAPAPRELPEVMRMQIYRMQQQLEDDLDRIRIWK